MPIECNRRIPGDAAILHAMPHCNDPGGSTGRFGGMNGGPDNSTGNPAVFRRGG